MDRLGIEVLCVFGMPPVAFVELAAELGCQHISLGLEPMPENPHGYPRWSLRNDPALRRALSAALEDRQVSIALGEGYVLRPGLDIRNQAADLALMAELGSSASMPSRSIPTSRAPMTSMAHLPT